MLLRVTFLLLFVIPALLVQVVFEAAASCDESGGSSSYAEVISGNDRVITSNGCPNHYNICTGKSAVSVCGDVGEEGTASEAQKHRVVDVTVPAYPKFRESVSLEDTDNGGIKCEMGEIGIALNGVSFFGGAVDTSCNGIDVDSTSSEWTGFDCCSGHSESTGMYHYHFPPSCLLAQIGDLSDGHSPQIGWALDGFPIYGPKGPGGIDMKYGTAASLQPTKALQIVNARVTSASTSAVVTKARSTMTILNTGTTL